MSDCSCHDDDRTTPPTFVPRFFRTGIPGRHNGRRAGKRGPVRPPPFRPSCHRKHRPSTKECTKDPDVDPVEEPVEEPRKPIKEFPPRRLARQELGLERQEKRSMRKQQEADRRLQEEQDEADRLLREQLNLHYFLDPDKDSPISSTD